MIYKTKLENSEVLALCKILLDSRAFVKEEMTGILGKLIRNCVPKPNRKYIERLIVNEKLHYIEPRHKTVLLDRIWEIGHAIFESRYIEIDYQRTKDRKIVHRKLQPVTLMFSEYYFYLAAFITDKETHKDFDVINDSFPTIYWLNRIKVLPSRMNISPELFMNL